MGLKLNAKFLRQATPITKYFDDGKLYCVGYRIERKARSKKPSQEFWLPNPFEMTSNKSMQCIDCAHAPHNLEGDKLQSFVSENATLKNKAWCPLQQHYCEPCQFKKRCAIKKPEAPAV